MKHLKVGLTFALVLAVLIIAFFGSVYLANKSKQHRSEEPTKEDTAPKNNLEATTPSSRAGYRVYTDIGNNFSFEFPADLADGKDEFTYLPYVNTKLSTEVSFAHEINAQYCAASGECKPTTTDFKFGVAIVDSPLTKIKATPGTKAEILKLDGKNDVLTFSQGAEGEGIIYYFLSLAAGKTLMFYQPYIDESILVSYKTNKDFMPFAKQKETMREVVSSFKITK